MDAHSMMIMEEFNSVSDSFEKAKDVILEKIRSLLSENKIMVTAVEGRVKEASSLEGKLERKGYKYKSLADITDLIGVRVITFYSNEVDKIASLVEQIFTVDWENSVDKRKMYKEDQFGYMSLHYVCSIPKELYFDPDHPEVNDYKFEIQMRTAMQHVWATAHHDTGYKSDVEVPKDLLRALNRLAGVLEIADEEFSKIISEINDYRRKVKQLVADGQFSDLSLDGDTFKNYLAINPFDKLNQKIAAINRAEIEETSFVRYLDILSWLGFKTIQDIEDLKKEYGDDAYKLALRQLGGTDIDIVASTIGLQNLCIIYILKKGGGEVGLNMFFDLLHGKLERNKKSAERTFNQAKEINII